MCFVMDLIFCRCLGHPVKRFDVTHFYGHCRANHLTHHYKCTVERYAGHTKCSHLSFQYLNYVNTIHASNDSTCCALIKEMKHAQLLYTSIKIEQAQLWIPLIPPSITRLHPYSVYSFPFQLGTVLLR